VAVMAGALLLRPAAGMAWVGAIMDAAMTEAQSAE
jgi:hypothetical protein